MCAIGGCGEPVDAHVVAGIGVQPRSGESLRVRRLRFHQSWFRAARLGVLDWGSTPSGRPLGSMLPDDAAARGLNFVSKSAEDLFYNRRAEGWGIDPVRSRNNMTSSQTLMLNILGPLGREPAWLRAVLERVLGRADLVAVERWSIEYAPRKRSEALNDMTRIDAYFEIRTASGVEGIVLELKYADRFNSRQVELSKNYRYAALAERAGIWRDASQSFDDRRLNQLIRAHALGAVALETSSHAPAKVTMLVVAHRDDALAATCVRHYREALSDSSSLAFVRLDEFFAAMSDLAPSMELSRVTSVLRDRYANEALSDPYWARMNLGSQRVGLSQGGRR